jgi:large repetitive protein
LDRGYADFHEKAKDEASNEDASPAQQSFTVDTPPETTIGSGPSGYVKSTSASFSFSSSESGSTFQCSRDGASFAGCTSPKSYSSLSQGNHTLRVRATDKAGNIDASPASRSWFVDTVVPKGTISINGGASSTSSRTVTLRLSASDPSPASGVDSMRFRNGGTTTWSSWFDYSTSHSWTLTAGAGTKTVHVQYKDRAGNNSATASDTIRFSP